MNAKTINGSTLISIGDAIDSLHDVAALIECAETQMDSDAKGTPAARALRVALVKLKHAITYFDVMDAEAV